MRMQPKTMAWPYSLHLASIVWSCLDYLSHLHLMQMETRSIDKLHTVLCLIVLIYSPCVRSISFLRSLSLCPPYPSSLFVNIINHSMYIYITAYIYPHDKCSLPLSLPNGHHITISIL